MAVKGWAVKVLGMKSSKNRSVQRVYKVLYNLVMAVKGLALRGMGVMSSKNMSMQRVYKVLYS